MKEIVIERENGVKIIFKEEKENLYKLYHYEFFTSCGWRLISIDRDLYTKEVIETFYI